MKQFTITKFTGLHVAENSTTVPDGALERANNVIINQDNLLQKRRGLKAWHTFPATQFINTLFSYENSIFAISQNKLYRFNNTVTTAACTWIDATKTITIAATAHGITDKDYIADFYIDNTSIYMPNWTNRQTDFYGFHEATYVGANSFTIEAQVAPTATNAVPTACYFRKYTQVPGQTIAVTTESRIAFSNGNAYFTTDNGVIKLEDEAANTLEAGIPPGLDIISASLSLTTDSTPLNTGFLSAATATSQFSKVAYKILFGRKDSNSNVVIGTPSDFITIENDEVKVSTSVGYATPLVTVTMAAAHGLAVGDIIFIYADDATDPLALAVGDPVTIVANEVGGDNKKFTFNKTGLAGITSISYQTAKCVLLTFTLPSEINSTEYFYRIYRTTQGITINDDYRLIEEKNITSAHIAAGVVTYNDEVYDELVTDAFLYTNSNQEGSLQSNDRPPICKDIALFKNSLFYANCKQYPIFTTNLLSADNIATNSYINIAGATYKFVVTGLSFPLLSAKVSTLINPTTLEIDEGAAHGMTTGEQVVISASTTHVPSISGAYTITTTANPNKFRITIATTTGSPGTVTYNKRWILKTATSGSVTVSESIDMTARAIVYTINQDDASLIYAKYISGLNEIPGKMVFFTKNFTNDFYIYASDDSTKAAFTPNFTKYTFPTIVPASTDMKSDTTDLPNALYISKPGEPEAVPLSNFLSIGSRDKAIIRIAALRDSLIILKEDGVYRLNGDSVANYSATLLDGTVVIKSANSLSVLNNSVYCLTNQGIVQITDSSVRVISRTIEPLINSIIGDTNLSTTSSGVAYESERTYMLSCKSPNTNLSIADNTYVYNYLTDGITTASDGGSVFKTALLNNKEDMLYTIDSSNVSLLYRERKDQKKTDYLSDEFSIKVDASIACYSQINVGSRSIQLTSKVPHGLLATTRITISNIPITTSALFTGAYDVIGIRTVATVVDEYTFTFDADSNATGSLNDTINYQVGVSEYVAVANVTNGSDVVEVTCNKPHGFTNAQTIRIDAYTITESTVPSNVAITLIDSVQFSFKLTAVATGSETVTVTISDKLRNYNYLTLTISGVQPQVGDGLISGNELFPIDEIYLFTPNKYIAYTPAKYSGLSTDRVFLGSGIRSIIRFSPVTLDQPNELKYFSEFSATFKNNSSFTKATLNFSNDFVYSTVSTNWDLKVGTDKSLISFGGWGQLEWGEFAWGGEYSVNRDFLTRPAVVLRTYVPKDVFVGTFIQPIIYHNKAGESIDLQSISLFSQPVTTRISR